MPQYSAFRTMEGWDVIPVVVRIECFQSGRPWGQWFSRITPQGAFREVPIDSRLGLESSDHAEELIRLIRVGKRLPEDFVDKLHVIQTA